MLSLIWPFHLCARCPIILLARLALVNKVYRRRKPHTWRAIFTIYNQNRFRMPRPSPFPMSTFWRYEGEPVFIWVCKVAVASILARPNGPALGAQRSLSTKPPLLYVVLTSDPGINGRARARATPRPHDLFPAQAPQYHISARVESYC